ncbi:MAG: acyl--CoA ligase [Ardenticatenales bacterium]|nr:acyl--CoA ligase [Ardenticatenales bacterium]
MTEHMADDVLPKLHAARSYKGQPPEEQMGYQGTLGDLLNERAAATPHKRYLTYYDEADKATYHSYAEFRDAVHQAASYMAEALGLRPGDRIANMAHNHADTVVIYFAAWALGVTVVPVNVGEDDERVAFIMHNAECKAAFVRPEYLARVVQARGEVPTLETVVQVGGESLEPGADRHFGQEKGEYAGFFTPPQPFDNTQEAIIVYTSGTTGAPKGVLLNQYNLLVDAQGVLAWHQMTAEQHTMCVLPIHHVNGVLVTLITPVLFGGSTVLNRTFSPRWFWQRVEDENIQVVSVVPTLLAYLLEAENKQQDFKQYDLSGFRHFICGAGPLTVQLGQEFEDTFHLPIMHGYGLSETTCYSCFLPLDLTEAQHKQWMRDYGYPSIGVPIIPNEMAIHDPEGNILPPGPDHKGEIVIRGHNIMQGYFRRPDANADCFAHGWFRSGDEGFMVEDEQGRPFYFITGRIKELIIRGGVNYSPFEIDEVLTAIPGVKIGLAVGFPNKYYGEEVGAYIVLEEGASVSEEEIMRQAREKLPFSKSPKVIVFGDVVPVTSTGKYQRLKLESLFAAHENSQFRE